MKKILVFLLVLLSAQVNAQIEETVVFDFTKPSSLNPPLSLDTSAGDVAMVTFKTFTSGPVEMSFMSTGQGVAINNASESMILYSLAIRARAGMKLSFSKSGYAFSYVQFEGALGDLGNVNSVTKRWTASDKSTTEVSFTNGIQPTRFQKITVCYTRAALPVSQPVTTPKSGDKVSSFKTMSLQFDLPMSVVHEKGIKLYTLDQDGERIGSQDMIATVSATDSRTILLTAEKEIMQDGSFEVYVPAGSFQNSEQSSSPEIKVPFTVYADRATLRYESVTPDPTEGNVPKVPATITLKYADNQSVSIVEDGEHEVVVYQDDVYNFTPVALDVDDHNVVLTLDGEMTAEGDWYVVIPEGTITNGFSPESPYYRCNPKTTLVYTVENELSLYRAEATALLAAGGKDAALIGYPADGTASRQALIDALANSEATAEELQKAIDEYYAEVNVKLPEDGKWYKLAAVNDNGEKQYLKYETVLSTTTKASEASAFKAFVNSDTQTYSFKTSDDKFLNVQSISEEQSGTLAMNLSAGGMTSLTLAKLAVEGQKLAGLLTLKGSDYAVVAFGDETLSTTSGSTVQYGAGLTSAFSFVETAEETNPEEDPEIITSPYAQFEKRVSERAGELMILTFLSVQKVSLLEKYAAYFTKGGETVDFEGLILTAVPGSPTQFYVNTRGLKSGTYNLVLPVGMFSLLKATGETLASEEITLSFVIDNESTAPEDPTGFVEDFYEYISYQSLTRSEPYIMDTDLNELYIYVHGDGVRGGIAADASKRVSIVQAYTNGELAWGHFEPYPEFAEENGFEPGTVQAVKLVMDEPLEEGGLDNASGQYGYRILAGTIGDLNFGRYLAGDPDVKRSDCRVNKADYTITFNVNNDQARKVYPSSETIEYGRKLLAKTGVGYPAEDSQARKVLQSKMGYVEGNDELYQGYFNDFYNETNVVKPTVGKYYKVYAVAADGTKAYLDYDGSTVGVTADPAKATGFKMAANEDGTYRFVTGNSTYLRQLSNETNTSAAYAATENDITIAKLSIEGVDAVKTFGLFSLKMENTYALVDVKNAKILAATATLADSDNEKTNAFMFEEVSAANIPTPTVKVELSPATGSEVDLLDQVRVTFFGVGQVELADMSLITLTDVSGESMNPVKVETSANDPNKFLIDFVSVAPGQTYFLSIGKGAFTYTFAEQSREVELVTAVYTITTGITDITVDPSDDAVYDLQGRKVTGTLKSGVYIKNGKKVYIK